MFILSRDRYSRPWASLFPSPLWKIIASKISAWKIGERALKVKRWENRQPGYRRSVGRSIVPLARRPSYRGRKATRNFVIHVSFIFYLKKIPFFSLQTKVVPSLFLSSSQFKLTFKIFSKRRKKLAAIAAPFLLILRFPFYAFVFLSHVTSIAKK